MTAEIKHNNEVIHVEKQGVTKQELINHCMMIIKNYYEHHKNTISIENEKIEVSIRLFEKPATILQEVKFKQNEKISV